MLKRPNKKEIAWKAEFHNAKKEGDAKRKHGCRHRHCCRCRRSNYGRCCFRKSAKEQHIAKTKKN